MGELDLRWPDTRRRRFSVTFLIGEVIRFYTCSFPHATICIPAARPGRRRKKSERFGMQKKVRKKWSKAVAGLPDFFGTKYQNVEKYTKLPQNIPKGHKIFTMAVK
jgi:hypothetical protein